MFGYFYALPADLQGAITEALPGVLGNRGMSFISGEQKNTSKNEGNRRTKVILGSRDHRKLRF